MEGVGDAALCGRSSSESRSTSNRCPLKAAMGTVKYSSSHGRHCARRVQSDQNSDVRACQGGASAGTCPAPPEEIGGAISMRTRDRERLALSLFHSLPQKLVFRTTRECFRRGMEGEDAGCSL